MKKKITTIFLTTAIALGFAQEAQLEQTLSANAFTQPKSDFPLDTKVTKQKGTIYLKMGVNDSELPKDSEKIIPGLGIGYRANFGASAIDVSVNSNYRHIRDAEGEKKVNYSYTLPKVNYLYYFTPASNQSFYAGGGLAWGGLKNTSVIAIDEMSAEDPAVVIHTTTVSEVREFHGIASNVAVGYEIGRNANFRTFFQLDVSQPTVAAIKEGKFPGPVAEFAIGAGF